MSILTRLLAPPEAREATLGEALLRLRSAGSGPIEPFSISPESALRHTAVWQWWNLIGDMVAGLPVDEYERSSTPGALPVQVPLSPVIAEPSELMEADEWRRQAVISCLARGNTYGYTVAFDNSQRPRLVEILPPDDVQPRRRGRIGAIEWGWSGAQGGIPVDRMWHIAAYTFPGSPIGLSPLTYAAEAVGLGRMAQRFGGNWFQNGSHPSALLINKGPLTEDMATEAKARFRESVDQGSVAALGEGWAYQAIQITPEESQFLDAIRANRAVVAGIFGLAPEDIGESSGGSLTYSTVELRQIARLVYPIGQWVGKLERAMTALLQRPERYVKINTDALLRTDVKTRTEVKGLRLRHGLTSVNEERLLEDQAGIGPDGDRRNWPPMNTQPQREA